MRRSLLFLFALLVLTLLFFWVYLPVLTKYRNLKDQEIAIDVELKKLSDQIRVLNEERNRLQNDVAYLEKVIREELGLVKPGEIVYKFVEDSPEDPAGAGEPAAAAEPGAV